MIFRNPLAGATLFEEVCLFSQKRPAVSVLGLVQQKQEKVGKAEKQQSKNQPWRW